MTSSRTSYPTDVSDDEWAFVAPYLMLLPEDAGQRIHSLREVFNGLRWIVRAGAPWRMMPNDLPPWWVVYQRSFAWTTRFRRLVRDYERLPGTLAGLLLALAHITNAMVEAWGKPGIGLTRS